MVVQCIFELCVSSSRYIPLGLWPTSTLALEKMGPNFAIRVPPLNESRHKQSCAATITTLLNKTIACLVIYAFFSPTMNPILKRSITWLSVILLAHRCSSHSVPLCTTPGPDLVDAKGQLLDSKGHQPGKLA